MSDITQIKAELRELIAQFQHAIESNTANLATANSELTPAQEAADAEQPAIDRANADLAPIQSDLAAAQQRQAEAQAAADAEQQGITNFQSAMAPIQVDLSAAQARQAAAQSMVEQCKANIAKFTSDNTDAQTELGKALAALADLERGEEPQFPPNWQTARDGTSQPGTNPPYTGSSAVGDSIQLTGDPQYADLGNPPATVSYHYLLDGEVVWEGGQSRQWTEDDIGKEVMLEWTMQNAVGKDVRTMSFGPVHA